MIKPLSIGRKALIIILIVTLLGSSYPWPDSRVLAAPLISVSQPSKGAGTLEGLISQRAGQVPGFRVDDKPLTQPRPFLGTSIVNPPGSTGVISYGVRGLAVWEAPNRFLLRWVPDEEWIPEEGYSLIRIVNGQPLGLIDGLGTTKTGTTQVQAFNRLYATAIQSSISSKTPAASKSPSAGSVQRYGDGLFAQGELSEAVASLRADATVTDQVRQALKQRQLLGVDLSNKAVEKALNNLKSGSVLTDQTQIISGQQEFVSGFNAKMKQAIGPQFTLPSQTAGPGTDALPIVANKTELARVREIQTAQPMASRDPISAAKVEDPVEKLINARSNLLTLANVNFAAALESGLGYVDEINGLSPGQFVDYFLFPTAQLRSLLTGKSAFDPKIIEPQISVEFGQTLTVQAPFNLQGYAMDHKAYLRWDDAVDSYTRNILSGYVIERKLAGETLFTVLNPDEPVVKMYAKDAAGNLLEPDILYTDETIANGSSASYQIRAVDVFGRTSAPCTAVDLTVYKTIPPATPVIGLAAMANQDLNKPVLTAVSPMSVGAEELQSLRQQGKLTQSQYDKLIAYGSLDEDLLNQLVASKLITQAQFDELLQITGKSDEINRRSQLENRIKNVRQSSPQKNGVVLVYNHSVVADENTVRLEEGLKEYRVYRSEALGKGNFSTPVMIATIALNQLALPYGSASDPRGDLIYYDPNVSPGHYYAYWVTAVDGSDNESPVQNKPQITAYPSEVVPGSPQNPANRFAINEALTIPQPKIAGFSERLQLKTPEELLVPAGGQLGSSSGLNPAKNTYLGMVTRKDLHRVVVVAADEVNADGTVTVGWLPSSVSNLMGYVIYRAHDPSGSALQSPPSEADLNRLQWSLINVNKDAGKLDIEEEQILTTNQLRDKLPLPVKGCYLYQVFLVKSDTYSQPVSPVASENPYAEGGRVTIQWSASTDPQVAGYRIYRSEIPREVVEGTMTNFVPRWDMIAQLVTGQQYVDLVDQSKVHYYQYKVSTVSIWGVESTATTIATPLRISTTIPPVVPAFLTPISQPGQVQLRWKPVYDATQYTIYRSEQSIPELKPMDLANAVLEATQQRIRKSATTPDPLRDKLTALTKDLQGLLKDEDALGVKVAEIIAELGQDEQLSLFGILHQRYGILALAPYSRLDQRSASEITWKPVQTLSVTRAANEAAAANGDLMTWTDTSVQYPIMYMYAIEAENEDRLASGLSSPVTSGPQKSTGPAAPDPVTLQLNGSVVQLSWKAYTLDTPMGYLVFKALEKDGQYQQCSPLLKTNEFSESLEPGQEWWYRVVIIDEVGLMSAATTSIKASMPAPAPKPGMIPGVLPDFKPGGITPELPGRDLLKLPSLQGTALPASATALLPVAASKPSAPVINVGEITSTTVALSWPAMDGVSLYKIYGYKTEQPEKLLATTDGKATSCIVTGLSSSTKYFFYVVATNELGDSPFSKVVSAATLAPSTTQPQWGKLTLEVTATSLDSVTLSWTDTGTIPEGYKIYCYKTEQPEQLLQTVSGSTNSFTAKGLTANTKYFFYVKAYKDGKESLPSNVANGTTGVQIKPNPVPIPGTPGSTVKVAGYTITNVKQAPLVGINGSIGEQTIGELTIAGLAPIPVRLEIQELRGDTLTKGSVSLSGSYQHQMSSARLTIQTLSINAGTGPAKITGRLTIPGITPIPLSGSSLTAEGIITLDPVTELWVGDDQLSHLQGARAQFSGPEPGLWADSGWLESSLGQITLMNQRLPVSSAGQLRVDFTGRISGLFNKVVGDGRPIDLVVPRLTGLTIESATIKLDQGVIDSRASRIVGKYNLPFIKGELTSTVVTPVDDSGTNRPPTPGRDQEQISNPGDLLIANEKFSFDSITANAATKGLTDKGLQALQGSMSHLIKSIKVTSGTSNTVPTGTQSQGQNTSMRMSMASTFTIRYLSDIPFAISNWDGQGILPAPDQDSPLDKVLVKELQDRSAMVNGHGMDKSGILQLEAAKTKLSLPAYQLANTPEQVSMGGPGYRGFEIIEGFMTLPPSGVTLRNAGAVQGQTYRLPIPATTIFYSRNGLIGRLDTESTSGTSVDIWLNDEVAATMSGAAIDLENNQVQWSMTGTITVPQLGKHNGADRIVGYGAFSDPQGGLIFRIEPEKSAVTGGSGRSVQITDGTLKGTDLYLDGRLSVNTGEITINDMDFVALHLYMGRDQAKQQAADQGQGLAAKPVIAQIKDFTMETRGVKVEQNRDGLWEFAVVGATALVNNLPLNEGCVINLDTKLDAKAGTFKAKLNYTYEQFLTIDVDVKYENGEFRGEGEFWFITGDEGDEHRSQATGTVQARVGVTKEGSSYWLFKLAYGQSTKTWKCAKCGLVYEGNHPPVKCPGTKGKPCDGKKDDFKTDWQCSLCKTVVHAKEAPKACSGKKDGKDCNGCKDDFKQVTTPKTQEDAAGAGLMLGPVQINNIMAMMGYNVELPKAKDGTFEVPVGFDNDKQLYEWKTLNNGQMFFVAKAYMTIWHAGERFLTLEPVRLVIASGPAVEMEASIKREGKLLAYGKIGYYHEDRRFFLQVKVPKIELPGIKARLEDLNLLLDFSPNKQIVNLSYPEMVKLNIPGMPWDFAGGFAYEHINANYAIKMKARAQYGFNGDFSILYVYAKVGLTVDANLDFLKGPDGQTLFEFQLMIMLEGDLRGGVKFSGKTHEILHAYVSLQGYLGKTIQDGWWVYGKAYLYYHIDLWLWETSGSAEWTVGKVPEGVDLIKPTLAKDEKPKG